MLLINGLILLLVQIYEYQQKNIENILLTFHFEITEFYSDSLIKCYDLNQFEFLCS